MPRRLAIVTVMAAIPIAVGVAADAVVWGVIPGVTVLVLGSPAAILGYRRDTRFSLKAFFMMGRSSGGGT
jgi:hypothetical protein